MKTLALALLTGIACTGALARDASDRPDRDLRLFYDLSAVDPTQYCLYQGQLYTRGIEIKTETGTYVCRLPGHEAPDYLRVNAGNLAWIKKRD